MTAAQPNSDSEQTARPDATGIIVPSELASADRTGVINAAPAPDTTGVIGSVLPAPDATGVISGATAAPDATGMLASVSPASATPPPSAAPLALNRSTARTTIGTYRVLRKLGEGGMGAVYLAEPQSGGDPVAVKVLSQEFTPDASAVARFRKEALMLQECRHEHVANMLEFGEDAGECYLVLEYVDGLDLKDALAACGPLPERQALGIVAAIASALGEAHRRGIVHRDIKPANVLLGVPDADVRATGDDRSAQEIVLDLLRRGELPAVKLSDFGLARHQDQTESMALTKTGAMLGTPYYISPEQCSGQGQPVAASDVYSLGATLFELIAGHPPFRTDDPVKLITMHCFDAAPELSRISQAVSEPVSRLVSELLAKTPQERPADGLHLASRINRLLAGETGGPAPRPAPPSQSDAVSEALWTWELDSAPEDLWPYVSNTERVNQALGLPSVTYENRTDPDGVTRKFGSFKIGFAHMTWEEYPFEWVEERRLGVLRTFESGPLEWFLSTVELEPSPSGGTRLTHHVRVLPRNWLGRLLAFVEVKVKGRKGLDSVYPRIDKVIAAARETEHAAETTPEHADPFAEQKPPRKAAAERIAQRAAGVIEAGGDTAATHRLRDELLSAPAQELARLRPYEWADRHGLPRAEVVDAFLRSGTHGLLELHWDILCPTCRVSSSVTDTLRDIEQHAHCEACELDFGVDFGRSIELIFRAHPDVREADVKTYCAGGPEHAPHVVSQLRVGSGESVELDLRLTTGGYVLRGPQLAESIPISIEPDAPAVSTRLSLSANERVGHAVRLSAGRQLIVIENSHDTPLQVRLERATRRANVLTAKDASRLPLFRELFPAEVLSPEQLSDMSTCTAVALRFVNRDELEERFGEAAAYHLLEAECDAVVARAAAWGGELSKREEGQVVLTFLETSAAVRFTLDEQQRPTEKLRRQFALHRGPAMSATVHDRTGLGRTGFVGKTINRTADLLDEYSADQIVLGGGLADDPEVRALLDDQDRPDLLVEGGDSLSSDAAAASGFVS